jgi:hypothetical protein
MDRRRQIRMTEVELAEFLDSQRMVTCATLGAADGPELRAALTPQAAKRVGIRFSPTRVSSWDHRKLG